MDTLSLRQLRSVEAVRRTGRIIAAAAELGLTQPAVTLQIRQVEAAIGMAAFERTRNGMRPTAAGNAVADAALAIVERLASLSDEIEALRGSKAGALRLGVVSTAKYFAPAIMAAFMQRFPLISVALAVGNRSDVITSLANRTVDLAIMGRPPREVPVRAVAFGEHPQVFVAPAGHPLTAEHAIAKERIAGEKLLVRERGSGTRISLEIFLGELPGRIDDLGIEMNSNETIKQAVMAGLGLAFISAHTIAQEVALGRLAVLDVEGTPIRRQWYSVTRADRPHTPPIVAFEQFLADDGHRFLPQLATGNPASSGGDKLD